ncbi:Transposon TX1 uncharacterized protein [Merluccius polli]|uniref:Transposon TX1 uncharacterized protein n=1 Tax=Merluccius polli TaxID=89951 RepID=A0AA47NV35_MERPO|nr:Transposon TX1 uncharacterized protein [Merluccius polli]
MEDLESGIVELQGLADSTGNREHIEALKTKKIALKDLLSTKAQGALVRSRFQSINEMDAPTSFFFGLEKKQNQSRSIHSLLSDDGQELTEPSQIRKRAVDFYSALYRSEYKEHEKYAVFCDNLPQVSIRSNANLGKPLSLQELHSALMNMQGGKAPGIDGLTVEFYKAFWDVIGEDLMAVLNESLAVGLLPLSCRRAVITLLPKKGNLQDIKNWRPVSLLCTEYKILSKALANRVKGVMDQVIHQDQTYCVPGRSIRDNVHLIRDVLDLSSSLGLDVGLISMDQEKAFDRVEHQYLWKVMESFGFNADLIAMIKVLYQDIESVLKFNGGLCAPFKVQRGVRQGCGCSAMLYAISIEPFLQRVRRHIKGFLLPGCTESVVLAAYADDVIIMTRDQADVDTLRTITEDFCAVSAAKARMVDFFWDRLHWVPQCVLFLRREEVGQGLVHLASRAATFRLQFIQRYLTGPPEVVWRGVTSCVLRLADPLVHGSRLDIQDSATPGLATMLIRRGTLVLKQLVDVAGPALDNAEAVGRQLGVTSGRYCGKLLDLWKKRLTETERRLLGEYSSGSLMPDPRDAFPDISLVPEMESYTGPLIHTRQQRLRDAHRKTLYAGCVLSINRQKLGNRTDTVWRERLKVAGEVRPAWEVLYKLPEKKRTADLQWRVLHGAIAVNAFICVLNPASSNACLFCGQTETLFHCFIECARLASLFTFLTRIFACFKEKFSMVKFIFGTSYKKTNKTKWRLINFIVGEAKLAIYLSRRNRVEGRSDQDPVQILSCSVRARVGLDFIFYKTMGDLEIFSEKWSYGNITRTSDSDLRPQTQTSDLRLGPQTRTSHRSPVTAPKLKRMLKAV